MNSLNSILVEGNIVADPVVGTTPAGTPVCTFSVASNRFYKEKGESDFTKETSFFKVETWARLAESVSDLGKKGRGVRVVGRLKQNRWVDSNGKNNSEIIIVAEHVEFKPEFKPETPIYNPNESTEENETNDTF